MTTSPPNRISRTFCELSEKDDADAESASLFARWVRPGGLDWDVLLTAPRILIVSEADVGKTYECRACQERLWTITLWRKLEGRSMMVEAFALAAYSWTVCVLLKKFMISSWTATTLAIVVWYE
jgi:hypothetical protein